MTTIPASSIVSVVPSVISAGGTALALNGLFLTNSTRPPIGSVLSFPSVLAVGTYFGLSSAEYTAAGVYFLGFDGSTVKPSAMLFAQYPSAAVGAYVRGASLVTLGLAGIQALTGTLVVVMDGATRTAASFSLSAATSFSNAATLIQTALNATPPTGASVTGSISGTTLTVTVIGSGSLAAGQVLTGAGITAGTFITGQLTGTAGSTGTYSVSTSQTVTSTTVTAAYANVAVSYDSVSGGFTIASGLTGVLSTAAYCTGTLAASLSLTSTTGAVLSQGAAAATPGAFMAALQAGTQNWASFTTLFNPDASGNANKLAFAAWVNTTNNLYAYIPWDTDITPTLSNSATSSLGYLLTQNGYSGTAPVYAPTNLNHATFICGYIASLDTSATNGRATAAFRAQSGLTAGVTDPTSAANLVANGYNYYGAYATAAQGFNFLYNGSISGPFKWLDSYVNQIWLNNALQLALVSLMTQMKSIPYSQPGYDLIRAACAGPINAALNFGAIRAGVPLSAAQVAATKAAAGLDISAALQNSGYYLQVLPATAQVRGARGTPPCSLWYMDGGSVQQINLASVLVQ